MLRLCYYPRPYLESWKGVSRARQKPYYMRAFGMKCVNPPTSSNLLHISHLLWHLREEMVVEYLETSLWALEWLSRSISPLIGNVFKVREISLKLRKDAESDQHTFLDASGEVNPILRALLLDEHPLIRVKACTLWFGCKEESKRLLCIVGEQLVKARSISYIDISSTQLHLLSDIHVKPARSKSSTISARIRGKP